LTVIYLFIVAMVLFLVVDCCMRERNLMAQATAAMVVIPLVLRLLRVK
jgi:hypothetical protein